MNRTKRIIIIFVLLWLCRNVLLLMNIHSGSVSLSWGEIFSILRGYTQDIKALRIIWNIRMPRLAAAALLGGALSVSGFLLQTFFHNPIAGPFVLGISSGAKLTVALTMVSLLKYGKTMNSWGMIIAALAGSMITMSFVLAVSRQVKRMSVLVICGVMAGYICSAITDFVITFADDSNIINLHSWSLGSFSGMSWGNTGIIAAVSISGIICAFLLSKPMSAYQLGEGYAMNLGVNLRFLKAALIIISSILSACVTAFAGPVSFVGVAVPHIMKSLLKTSKPIIMIPACVLGGEVFCLFCDLLARTLFSPTELSISSVTAVFGAPVVVFMMLSREKEHA